MSLIRLAGLWKPKEKKKYGLSGKSGDVVYFIFPNEKKQGGNSPDYYLCMGQAAREENGDKKEETPDGELPF